MPFFSFLSHVTILESPNFYDLQDPRIRLIDHVVNRGLPAARNTGFANALSPYVFQVLCIYFPFIPSHLFQMDSDDLIEPTTLEKSFWCLENHPEYAIYFSNLEFMAFRWAFVSGYTAYFGAETMMQTNGFMNPVMALTS